MMGAKEQERKFQPDLELDICPTKGEHGVKTLFSRETMFNKEMEFLKAVDSWRKANPIRDIQGIVERGI